MTDDRKVHRHWRTVAIVAVLATLTACGPAAKLRRAKRLIAQAEAQGATWSVDTVFAITTVPIKSVEHDTVVYNVPGDTIVIIRDKLRVKLKVMRDSIYVKGECLPDTIKVIVPVQVNKTIECPRGIRWWEAVLGVLLAFVLGYAIRLITSKK